MWFNALIIIAAVACGAALLQLRGLLMAVFPSLRVRRLPADALPPPATADLYEKAIAELTALGFSPPQWVVIAPEKETPGAFATFSAVFCHAEKNVLAVLGPPSEVTAPNALTTLFITRLADGRKLTSQVRNVYSEVVADNQHLAQTIAGNTLAEQWEQHLRWVAGFQTPAAAGFGSLQTLSEELQKANGDDLRLVNAGKLWRDAQGVARPTLAFALRFLWLYWTKPKPKTNKTNVPLVRQVMFATFNEHWQARPLPARWQWLLLVISSIVLGAVSLGLAFTPIILGVILLYEGGHYLVMRAFGYKHVQMLALPLSDGISVGIEQKPSATRHAWMAIMGFLPGFLLSWALLCLVVVSGIAPETSSIKTLGIAFLVVNCFYLFSLPLPTLFTHRRATRSLAANPFFGSSSPDQQRRLVLATLQQCYGETANMARRLRQLQTVLTALTQKAINWKQRTILVAVCFGLLCLPFVFFGLAVKGTSSEPPSLSFFDFDSEKHRQTQQRVFLSLNGLDVPQLLARMPAPLASTDEGRLAKLRKSAPPPPLPDPAALGKVTAAQKRLGLTFSSDYRKLLSLHDGYPPLQLLPIAQVRRLSETDFFDDEGHQDQEPQTFYSFAFPPSLFEENATDSVPGQRGWRYQELQSCAVIGSGANAAEDQKNDAPLEGYPMLLWCPGPAFEQARIVSLSESLWAPDFTTYLRYKVTQKIAMRELAAESQ